MIVEPFRIDDVTQNIRNVEDVMVNKDIITSTDIDARQINTLIWKSVPNQTKKFDEKRRLIQNTTRRT